MYRNPSSSFSLSYTSEMGVETLTMLWPFTRRKKAWLEFSCRRRLGGKAGERGKEFHSHHKAFPLMVNKGFRTDGRRKSLATDSSEMAPPKAAPPLQKGCASHLEVVLNS